MCHCTARQGIVSRGRGERWGGSECDDSYQMITCHCYVMMESVWVCCSSKHARNRSSTHPASCPSHTLTCIQKEGISLSKSLISYEPLLLRSHMQSHFPTLLLLCGLWRHCVLKNRSVWVRHDRAHSVLEGKKCKYLRLALCIIVLY